MISLFIYDPRSSCRRKAREQKAYAKQVQAEKVKERAQEKKRQISQVQQLRKQREKSVSGLRAVLGRAPGIWQARLFKMSPVVGWHRAGLGSAAGRLEIQP